MPSVGGHCSDFTPSPDPPQDSLPSSSPRVKSASPKDALADLMFAPSQDEYVIEHLTRDQERVLGYHRLAHAHFRRMSDLHKYAKGYAPSCDRPGHLPDLCSGEAA
jgi:hypothetical protein